jgi:hypothetical protein
MTDAPKALTEKLSDFMGKWTSYAAFGSFLLYLFGYLTLRFQLSTYGLVTDLDLLDEKYLFAGCRFLVYFISSVPNVIIIFLPLLAISTILYKLLPRTVRARIRLRVTKWCADPLRLSCLGIVIATLSIQFAMRKCFAFGNLLLAQQLPDRWISSVLLTDVGRMSLYFAGLISLTSLAAAIAWYACAQWSAATTIAKFAVATLVVLVAMEFLLLPVNYGVLVSTRQLPRVAEFPGDSQSLDSQRAWLVWNSKETLTYFIFGPQNSRMLLTVPRKDTPVKIVAYDDIYCALFSSDHAAASYPCPR